jgi:hypothetical protein
MRVFGLIEDLRTSMSIVQPAADDVLVAQSGGGCMGTYTTFPPGISMLLIYLSRISIYFDTDKTVDILVKEGFKHNDFVSFLNESHECTEHAY